MSSAGALTPQKAAEDTLKTGEHHLSEALQLTILKNIYGGLILSAGGLLTLTIVNGAPTLTESNPGIARLMQGLAFPIGLVLVYFAGGELFTGYPMWYTMAALSRKGHPLQYLRGIIASWVSNLVGAVFFAGVFTRLTGVLSEDPFKSGVVEMVNSDIIEEEWHVLFLRAIFCGFMVTLAMLLGTQNHDGISKALGLHLPFLISTTAKSPHTVEYMYVAATGMMLGSPLSIGAYFWKCLLPITLGNTVGGAIFSGLYLWWVYIHCEDESAKNGSGNGWGPVRLDEDD